MRFPAFILVLFVAVSGFALTPVQDIQLSGAADGGGVTFTNLGDVVLTNGVRLSTVSAQAGATNAIGGGALVLGYDAATRTVTGLVSSAGTVTGAVGSGRLSLGVSGASITGGVDVTGLATGSPVYSIAGLATGSPIYSIAGLATGTPIYVESGITSGVAQGQTANMSITGDAARRLYFTVTGLATGTPIYSVAGLATGSPLYAESDSAAISQVGAASNSLRASVDGATTNIAALSNAALSAIGTVATNLNAASNALASSITTVQTADVARASGISNSIAALTGVYLQRSNNLSDVLSSETARGNLGLGTAATNSFTNAIYGAGTIFGLAVSTNTAAPASIPVRGTASKMHPMTLGGDVSAVVSGATQLTVTVGAGAITWSKLDSNTVDAVLARDAELTTNAARIAVLETNTFPLAAGLLVGVAASNAQVVASNAATVGAVAWSGYSATTTITHAGWPVKSVNGSGITTIHTGAVAATVGGLISGRAAISNLAYASAIHAWVVGQASVANASMGSSIGGYVSGDVALGENAYGATVRGYYPGTVRIAFDAAGADVRGYVGEVASATINTAAYGSVQAGAFDGPAFIGEYAAGAGQYGFMDFGASATNLASGSLQLFELYAGERAFSSASAGGSVTLGPGTNTHRNAIVVGPTSSSGTNSVTAAGGFFGAGGGLTALNGAAVTNPPATFSAAWSSNAATTAVNMHTNQLLQVSGLSFVINSTTTTPLSLRVQTGNTLQYINSTGTGSTIIRSDNLSAQGVQTVAGYNSSITNYWRIVSTAPTSANASGSRGDLHVSGTNAFAYDGSAWFRWAATTNW